jgi:hypothetical protein
MARLPAGVANGHDLQCDGTQMGWQGSTGTIMFSALRYWMGVADGGRWSHLGPHRRGLSMPSR